LNGFLITIKGYFTKYPTVSSGTLWYNKQG